MKFPDCSVVNIFKKILWLPILTIFTIGGYAADVTLLWDPSLSPNVNNYNIYVGEVLENDSCHFTSANNPYFPEVGDLSSFLMELVDDDLYCFAVTAQSDAGIESEFSNVVWTNVGENVPEVPTRTAIAASGATIRFEAMAAATWLREVKIKYWEQLEDGVCTAPDPESVAWNTMRTDYLGEGHLLTDNNLLTENTYCYQVYSRDVNDNQTIYYGSFTPIADTTPPIFMNITATTLNGQKTIQWETDEQTTGQLLYWTKQGNNACKRTNPAITTPIAWDHSVQINTTANICYQISATNNLGLTTQTAVLSEASKPSISNVMVTFAVTGDAAAIKWETNEATSGKMQWSTTPDSCSDTNFTNFQALDTPAGFRATSFTLSLDGLIPESGYCFRIIATDAEGNSNTYDQHFVSHKLLQNAPETSSVGKNGQMYIHIAWTTSYSAEGAFLVKYWNEADDALPLTAAAITSDQRAYYVDLPIGDADGELPYGANYHYQVVLRTTDEKELGLSDVASFTVPGQDITAPVISEMDAINIGINKAGIIWTTDEETYGQVQYWLRTGDASIPDDAACVFPTDPLAVTTVPGELDPANLNKKHAVDLTGLTPKTGYCYHIVALDPFGNEAQSAPGQFTTLEQPVDNAAPIATLIATPTTTKNKATFNFTTDKPAQARVHYKKNDSACSVNQNYNSFTMWSDYGTNFKLDHAITINGLSKNTDYCYWIETQNEAGTTSAFADSPQGQIWTLSK